VCAALVCCAALASSATAHARAHARPIHLDPANGHYLVFHDRPTVLVTSAEHYGAVMNLEWDENDYRSYLDELQRNDLNLTRILSGAYRENRGYFAVRRLWPPFLTWDANTLGPEPGKFLAPWAQTDTPSTAEIDLTWGIYDKYDLSRWNPAYFKRLKDFVAQADRRGIAVEYTFFHNFFGDGPHGQWTASPLNPANNVNGVGDVPYNQVHTLNNDGLLPFQEALVRKVVTELNAFDNVYYETIGEPYVDGPGYAFPDSRYGLGGDYTAWEQRMIRTIEQTERGLPQRHLVAQNVCPKCNRTAGPSPIEDANPAVSIFNFHGPPTKVVAENYHLGRVISYDEALGTGSEASFRTGGWDFLFAGGGVFDFTDYSFGGDDPVGSQPPNQSWIGVSGPALRAQIGVLSRFVSDLPVARMRPADDAIAAGPTVGTARVLAKPGELYAAYLNALGSAAHTESITLRVPGGRYLVRWVDPITGHVTQRSDALGRDGTLRLTSPSFTDDAVVLVTRGHGAPAHAHASSKPGRAHVARLPSIRLLRTTSTSHPFNTPGLDVEPVQLEQHGYAEQEYLVSGRANVYEWSGQAAGVDVKTPLAPYTTRIVVRAPSDPARFSGTVIVEPLNSTSGWDFDVMWAAMRQQLMSSGDAWVGISMGPAVFPAMQKFDASRYGALSMANPNRSETCTSTTEAGLAWDALAQVGRLLRSGKRPSPLAGLDVRDVFAAGHSQSGSMLITYMNAVAPISHLPGGGQLFDGYLLNAGAGLATLGVNPINGCAPPLPLGEPRTLVRPPGVPVISTQTQSDYYWAGGHESLLDDSDRFRLYHVPGSSHVWRPLLDAVPNGDELARAGFPPFEWECTVPAGGQPNPYPLSYVLDGAFANLVRWSREGVAPPTASRISVTGAGQPDAATVLDAHGNAVGGVRTPYVDVPTGTYHPTSEGPGYCGALFGSFVPFAEAELRSLYPTHRDYVDKVTAQVRALVHARWYTAQDGARAIHEAEHADVP